MRLLDGISKSVPEIFKYKLFSSGTQSKHQPKLACVLSKSQTSFIHWPPHGAGSKNGTTRKGEEAVFLRPAFQVSPSIILGRSLIWVSSQ